MRKLNNMEQLISSIPAKEEIQWLVLMATIIFKGVYSP
jgi:hypothetical protein